MLTAILIVTLLGSLYGNYWFYQKLKLAEAAITQPPTLAVGASSTPKAAA